MGKRPVIVTCLVLAFGCSLCFATTAVVFVGKDRILIGTDSLWRGWSGRTLRTGTMCKIDTERPNCIFAVVGFVQERKTGFNPNQYARSACAAHLSLLETAQRFGEIAKRPLERAIEYSRLNAPDGYKYLRGKAVLNGIFAGFENGKPVVATKGFVLEESGVLREDHALESNSTNSFLLYGDQGAAERLLGDPERPREPLALVRKLIQVQIEENPQNVGPPISILELTNHLYRWLDPGTCKSLGNIDVDAASPPTHR